MRPGGSPIGDIGAAGQGLYMVVMPAGVGSNQSGVIGEHSYYSFGSPATNVPFGWVTQGSVDSFSVVFSHELVEACTDPEGTGWTSATACGVGHGGWCEIGDVCQGSDARVHGVLVQRYWSNADNQCVVPDDPKVAQDSKIRKDSKDSKDHKDTKDRKDHKEKDNPKELKDGAKEKEAPKELERPSSGPMWWPSSARSPSSCRPSSNGCRTKAAPSHSSILPSGRPSVMSTRF